MLIYSLIFFFNLRLYLLHEVKHASSQPGGTNDFQIALKEIQITYFDVIEIFKQGHLLCLQS